MFYYADRQTKNDNRLVTSYNQESQAQKYGGRGSTIQQGLLRGQFVDGDLQLGDEGEVVVRSIMECEEPTYQPPETSDGQYEVWCLNGDLWERLGSFDTYGNANTEMKRYEGVYPKMVVLSREKPRATVGLGFS